jgi:hypothetical protein
MNDHRLVLTCLCLSLLLPLAGGAQVQDLPRATTDHGGFAFPDQSGARLLFLPTMDRADVLKTAVCTGGRRELVQFARHQTASGRGNGREGPANFDNLAGSVFEIPLGKVDPDATCFLASQSLLAGGALLELRKPQGVDACAQRDRLTALRNRRVVQCWPLAALERGQHLVLVEFERRGSEALASLVLVDGGRAIFADYPATFRGAGQDLWRVDDAGVLSPDGLTVVFVLQRDESYSLAIGWSGAEGRLLSLWISQGGDRFLQVIRDYWYRAPI